MLPSSTRQLKKGLAYIYGYDLSDFENFKESLKSDLGVAEVEQAPWIKPKNKLSRVLLLSFFEEVPLFVSIPGEQAKTQVYAYKDKPQMCKKCTLFFHSEKFCASSTRCARCSEEGHRADSCNNPMNCPHCSGKHKAGDKNCPEFRKYEEILAIQTNEKVSRQQAQVIYLRNNPNQGMNFAKAVTSTSTPTVANKFKSLDPNKAPSVDNSRNSKDKAASYIW